MLVDYADVVEYYGGMIAMRKAHPVFRLRTAEEVRKRLKFHNEVPHPNAIMFSLDGKELEGEDWETTIVLINPNGNELEFTLPSSERFDIYAADESVSDEPIGTAEGKVKVPGRTLTILAKKTTH